MKYFVLIGIVVVGGLLSSFAVELGIGYPLPFIIVALVWIAFWWMKRAKTRPGKAEKPIMRYTRLSLATFGAVFGAALLLAIVLMPVAGLAGFEYLLNPLAPIILLALSLIAFPWIEKYLR